MAAVRALAADWRVHVLLKGRSTLIANPDGHVFVNEAGGSWAATAGAGDVLSGMIGVLMSAGMAPDLAAAAGARAHSTAADLAARGGHDLAARGGRDLAARGGEPGWAAPTSASAILDRVPAAVRSLRGMAES